MGWRLDSCVVVGGGVVGGGGGTCCVGWGLANASAGCCVVGVHSRVSVVVISRVVVVTKAPAALRSSWRTVSTSETCRPARTARTAFSAALVPIGTGISSTIGQGLTALRSKSCVLEPSRLRKAFRKDWH